MTEEPRWKATADLKAKLHRQAVALRRIHIETGKAFDEVSDQTSAGRDARRIFTKIAKLSAPAIALRDAMTEEQLNGAAARPQNVDAALKRLELNITKVLAEIARQKVALDGARTLAAMVCAGHEHWGAVGPLEWGMIVNAARELLAMLPPSESGAPEFGPKTEGLVKEDSDALHQG